MNESIAKKVLLPAFTLTKTCKEYDSAASLRVIKVSSELRQHRYHFSPVYQAGNSFRKNGCLTFSYNLLPLVLNSSGAIWAEANLYILSRLEGVTAASMATYHGLADDLASYLRFLEEENIDFLHFPTLKLYKPTYRYKGYLTLKIQAGELAITTAKRRMGSVISFYRWMKEEGLIATSNSMWKESDIYIQFKDTYGFNVSKKISTTDISIHPSKQHDPYDETINDGGRLRPLYPNEQEWIVDALLALGNTEMTLVHLVALLTGARIQTIFTMRVKHFYHELVEDSLDIKVLIGPGTSIDTKGNKNMVLIFPRWLYEKLYIYSHSERAEKRRKKSGIDNSMEQYLFLSIRGVPIYEAKSEAEIFNQEMDLRHAKKGQALRQFITDKVIPFIKEKHNIPNFHYQFHDLRASFGMNLTDRQLKLVENGSATLHQVREYVKTRMGHASASTTDRYLTHRKNLHILQLAQTEYEDHLSRISDSAKNNL